MHRIFVHSRSWSRRSFATSVDTEAFIAIGSNVGNRVKSIEEAMAKMRNYMTVKRTSHLYESKPMYITDQPLFINGVVQVRTSLPPLKLLSTLKTIETSLGRDLKGLQNGPRPIDLDIVKYGDMTVNEETLQIPHPRAQERNFVLRPLCDINPDLRIGSSTAMGLLYKLSNSSELVRVTPLPSGKLLRWGKNTILMGIINATPDSFSDGGVNSSLKSALQTTQGFLESGFHIIDIGGQSTGPCKEYVPVHEEIDRVIPIIQEVHQTFPDTIISCDTFNSATASEAIRNGADIINDVSAGTLDADMHHTIATSNAATVQMHMRGTSQTMQSMTEYTDVVQEVSDELRMNMEKGMDMGISRWSMISDPGIGFAKRTAQNWQLVSDMARFQAACGDYPTLLALSRKTMFGLLTDDLHTRDWCTAGALSAAIIRGGVDMVRVHNKHVAASIKAADLMR